MDIPRIIYGLLLIIVGILSLILAEYQGKNVGSRGGYVFSMYVGAGGFLLIGIVEILGGILN